MFSELLSIGQGYGRQYRSTGRMSAPPSTASTSFQCANLLQITQPQSQITPTTIFVVASSTRNTNGRRTTVQMKRKIFSDHVPVGKQND